MRIRTACLVLSGIFLLSFSSAFSQEPVLLNSSSFGSMNARQIGPAVMSGRITAIDAVDNDGRIMYVGGADGGVWKSITGGTLFKPIFDKYSQSIGAITIDQKNPDIVWVGTGESNMRNTVSVGTGIYKTLDGGDDWQKMGLDNTEHISKIVIDPDNDNIVYVAAPGPLWSNSEDRGLYKTADGGQTWEKILYVDEKTGCADIILDPRNPDIIYASMWEFRRKPWTFSSGGPGSGLFKSIDGGHSWNRIDKDFSEGGELGRICLAVSPSDPKLIYAIAESKNTGLFQSTDGGETWTRNNSASGNVTARPFYFSVLQVDPSDAKRIYRPAYSLSISDDGGQSFRQASFEGGWVHSDHHALWIDPKNPKHLYLGTDGGVYVSFDRGNNWLFLNTLPLSQYYHITFDYENPYNLYGGLQDNGSWMGPSKSPGGIRGRDWLPVGFGDGFCVMPDLTDKDIVYWEYQGGQIGRFSKKTNESKDIQPYPKEGEPKLRYNWNTPIYQSPNDKSVFYIGAQYLYRTSNKGDTWDKISPDLTTNDPEKEKQAESGGLSVDNSSAENHCTIYTICESGLDANLIWVGTDDGNIQVTENGGDKWTNVVANLPNLPKCTWCSSIEASRYDRNTAYATFDGHAFGDMKTYIFKTTDLGRTWRSLSTPDLKGYAHKIKEDIEDRDLLFLGTEMGLFVSIDGGYVWAQYTANVPDVAIRDINIQPQTNDLLLASHGRGILIVDDITPLRHINHEVLSQDAAFLPTRPNYLNIGEYSGNYPDEAGNFVGPNPTEDAVITYYLKERAIIGDFRIEVYNSEGKLIKTLEGSKRKGINRVTWDMRMKLPRVATGVRLDYGGFISPLVPEGNYTVKLIKGDKTYTTNLDLKVDPNSPYSKEERDAQYGTFIKLYNMEEDLAFFVDRINVAKTEAGALLKKENLSDELKQSLKSLTDTLEGLRKTLVATQGGTGITGEEQLREKLGDLYGSISSYNGKPTDSQMDRVKGLEYDFQKANESAENISKTHLEKVNAELQKAGMNKIELETREAWDKKTEKM
jgi:photosystem II stability/assembly factor-like uncharacterized protein